MRTTKNFPDKIDTVIRFFFYVCIFWLPYSKAVVECCLIISVLLWIIKRIICFLQIENRSLKKFSFAFKPIDNFLNPFIAAFILACVLSIIGGVFWEKSLSGFMTKTMEWFAFYWLFIEVFKEKKQLIVFFLIFLFTAFSTSIDGIVQYHLTGTDIFNGHKLVEGRATASFDHANGLGAYIAAVFPLFIAAMFISRKKIVLTCMMFFSLLILMWSLLITFSRAGWIACFLGIVLMALFRSKKSLLRTVLPVILITLLSGVWVISNGIGEKNRISTSHIEASIQWRMNIWQDSLTMIKDRPYFGHGINTFMTLFQEYRREREKDKGGTFGATYAHNSYLQVATETGIIGLVSLILLFSRVFQNGLKFHMRYQYDVDYELTYLHLGLYCGISAILFHSFFDVNFYTLQLSALIWIMIGFLVTVEKLLSNTGKCDIKET